jgi:putative addiction module killer protein
MPSTVLQTKVFREWLGGLTDETAKGAITARINRIESGLLGDFKAVGGKVIEFRVDVSKGYRFYGTWTGKTLIVLLNGGHKKGQSADITAAQGMVEAMEKAKKEAAKKSKK